jgi:HAD superfamily hydrolase (TIGR01490 family)
VGQAAAFFDLDKTVIDRASMVAFGRPLYREGLISRRLLLRALYGQLIYLYIGADERRVQRMKNAVLALTKGWEQERVRAIVQETLHDVIEPIVFDEALDLIAAHRADGHPVFIVSASPEEIVGPLAEYLGVDGYLASRSEVDDNGRYSGRMAFYCYGPEKRTAMEQMAANRGIDLTLSYSYSDSATDLPMLECVGHPVAVNPDRELARAARERDWEIHTFSRKVRLRNRLPTPPPGPTAAVGGGVAAVAVVALAAWWWLRRSRPTPSRSTWGRLPDRARLTRLAPSWLPRQRAQRGR